MGEEESKVSDGIDSAEGNKLVVNEGL